MALVRYFIGLFLLVNVNGVLLAGELEVADKKAEFTSKQKRIIADLNESNFKSHQKHLRLKVTKISDNESLGYLGAYVSKADLAPFLSQMSDLLGEDFKSYRNNQALRDHGRFHLTLVNPIEYKRVDTKLFSEDIYIDVTFLGLGKVSDEKNTAYYVVARSNKGALLRQKLLLKPKDFHVTLGFTDRDVYTRGKGVDTIIK